LIPEKLVSAQPAASPYQRTPYGGATMSDYGISPLHFIPIGRVIADPLELPTAITMAIFGRKATDASLYQDGNGDIVLGVYNPRTGQQDHLRPGDDHVAGHEFGIMLVHGGAVLGRAMRDGDLDAFVIAKDGTYLRVPRLYWLKAYPASSRVIEQNDTGHVPYELVGSPLLVDPADIDKWISTVRPAVEAMVLKTRKSRGEKVVQHRPRTRNPGRDPYRLYESVFKRLFSEGDFDDWAKLGQKKRWEKVRKAWPLVRQKQWTDETCPHKGGVNNNWERFLRERARS